MAETQRISQPPPWCPPTPRPTGPECVWLLLQGQVDCRLEAQPSEAQKRGAGRGGPGLQMALTSHAPATCGPASNACLRAAGGSEERPSLPQAASSRRTAPRPHAPNVSRCCGAFKALCQTPSPLPLLPLPRAGVLALAPPPHLRMPSSRGLSHICRGRLPGRGCSHRGARGRRSSSPNPPELPH